MPPKGNLQIHQSSAILPQTVCRSTRVTVKLLMSWDIKPGQETAYFNFVVQEFAPEMNRLGLTPTDAWYTVYGKAPQILTSGETIDVQSMERILQCEEWMRLRRRLMKYILNFRQKVVPSTGRFQLL
jgi:hypothetical protein